MSDRIIRSAPGTLDLRTALPWLVGAGVYLLLLTLGPRLLNDPDTYSHVTIGRWILSHRAVPHSDLYSFSVQGTPWVSFEWLSQVIYASVHAVAGWAGVVALAAAAIALALGLLTHFLLRELPPAPALVLIVAAILLLTPHLLARPHVLILPLMVIWAAALVRSMDRRGPPPYGALPLLVLWANLHGSVVLALGLIGPAILEALLAGPRSEWPRILLRWVGFSTLAIVACCMTPYGAESLLIPVTTLGLGPALLWIAEWRPQDFSRPGSFEILLLGGIFFALSRGVTLPVTRVLVLLGLVHLALSQVRHADLLAVLAPLYLAAPLARHLGAKAAENAPLGAPRGLKLAALAAMIVATALQSTRSITPAAANTPSAAIAGGGLTSTSRVLNDYSFGGYLIHAGIPTFIDGRGEIFGGKFIVRYNRGIALADLDDFLKLLDEYRIDATLLDPATPAVRLLDIRPDWKRVYSDDIAVVHKRRTAPE